MYFRLYECAIALCRYTFVLLCARKVCRCYGMPSLDIQIVGFWVWTRPEFDYGAFDVNDEYVIGVDYGYIDDYDYIG